MKFLCDHMLIRLGKWLRAAGFDTAIIGGGIPDDQVLEKAIREKRVLITRDKRFKSQEKAVIWLRSNAVDDCAIELTKKISVNWLKNPFSRCLVCNSVLQEPTDEDLKRVPKSVFEYVTQYSKCSHCDKIFWLGSHTEKMLKKLRYFASFSKEN